jgi:hypothetical protein
MILNSLFSLTLCLLVGCSVELVRTSDPDKELHIAPRLDPNGLVKITKSEDDPNKIIVHFPKVKINLSKPCSVKYQPFYFDFLDLIVVPGILPNGKVYSIWLDTGDPGYVLTNSLTILENNLAIYPLGKQGWSSAYAGLCYLSSLELGQAIITDPPCRYLHLQWEVRLLGLPIWQQKGALVGLGLMRDFGYIVFDNISKEVELAPTGQFIPEKPQRWESYSFEIENGRLVVSMPVEDRNSRITFDTCGRYGMVVGLDMWMKLPEATRASAKIKESKFFSGFLGQLSCRKATVRRLKIGSLALTNAEIVILPEDSPYLTTGYSISMKYFKNHVVVLDFDQGLMWVKKHGAD